MSRVTEAPGELFEFLDRLRLMGTRTAKGEFVSSDGTRIPYEITFEKQEKPEKRRTRAAVDDE